MSNKAEYRKLLSELGIDDDRAEQALVDMFCEKDAQIRLARDSVSDREWALQNQLMEMEAAVKTTKQRLIDLGLTPLRVECERTGKFRGMAIHHNGAPIHGTMLAHVDYAIEVCNLLESGHVLPNDIERCTGTGCHYRGDCKRFLAGLIDTGPVPFADPDDGGCTKMIQTDGYFCDTHCTFLDHHKDCKIGD